MSCGGCLKKHGWIRGGHSGKGCPFGLPIPLACAHAGSSVAHMCPLEAVPEDKGEKVSQANRRVYIWGRDGRRCLYAREIIEAKDAVNCDFGDTGQGMGVPSLEGSPLYAQTFSGIGLDGLYAFPLGFYADNNESRNLFQGLFSLLGSAAPEIIKEAVSRKDEELWAKIERQDILLPEEQDRLSRMLEECRQEFEGRRTDAAKVRELADKWNSRRT